MVRFYLATKVENWAMANEVADALICIGWYQAYRWTGHGTNGSVEHLGDLVKRNVAELETEGVSGAEALIVLAPGGRGTHCEIGIALGTNKPIFIWAENEKDLKSSDGQITTFYYHPLVARCICSKKNVIKNIVAWSKRVIKKDERLWSRL